MFNSFKPKKSLGQHFLRSEKALRQIVATVTQPYLIFEIGPGEGVLSKRLLEVGHKVVAVEIDKRSVEFLKINFQAYIQKGQLTILEKNCLEVDYGDFLKKRGEADPYSYTLVGNIPYYLTGAIFRHAFEQKILPKQVVFLVQKEVAQRIMARDGKESLLSVSIKIFLEDIQDVKIVDWVKAGSFLPPPKVDSAILNIQNIKPIFKNSQQQKLFFILLKSAFSQKRKFLMNNLKTQLPDEIFHQYQPLFQEIFVNKYGKNIRAESIKVIDWKKIIDNLV